MVRRAEQANFKALVVTVDTVLLGRRLATERNELRQLFHCFNFDYIAHQSCSSKHFRLVIREVQRRIPLCLLCLIQV